MNRMSLGDGLDDVNILDSAADKVNQNVISRYQSMMINEEQHLINDDQIIAKKDLQDPES